jgi:hypothetical protein
MTHTVLVASTLTFDHRYRHAASDRLRIVRSVFDVGVVGKPMSMKIRAVAVVLESALSRKTR